MEDFRILKGLKVHIDREQVLKMMDCYEDSPVYEEVLEEFEEHKEELRRLAEPCGILGMTRLPEDIPVRGTEPSARVIYSVVSVGNRLKDRSTAAFAQGDYVLGMMADAFADAALFSLENEMIAQLREFCREHHVGIRRRMEAPADIPMTIQKAAHEFLKLKERLNIGITEGFMFDPVKTSCQVFLLSDKEEEFKALHDCSHCGNVSCKLRHIPPCSVTVVRKDRPRHASAGNPAEEQEEKTERIFQMAEEESLMEALIREGFLFSAICGGQGRCGKCGVQVLEGNVPVTAADRACYSKDELEAGWRLSCMAYPKEDIRICIGFGDETDFEILGLEKESFNTVEKEPTGIEPEMSVMSETEEFFDAAVDIGTTTIAMVLVGEKSGKIPASESRLNSQRMYGADVITRIQASIDGKREVLQKLIRQDLEDGIGELLKDTGITIERVRRTVISGNTTMGHLLMGYDCSGLGVYPFTPVNIDFIRTNLDNMAEVILLPGISPFVGGDIAAGLYECGFDQTDEICMLIDLGTNGEMAIGNRERILVTSTAAGPAFEGGNISCGCGSIPGAVCAARISGNETIVKTIRNLPPVGICGTGVLEITAELLKEGWIDETGAMDERYFEKGFPITRTAEGKPLFFTQKDVREVQLAKAAIRAGVETLILRYGVEREKIRKVFLAGGFGYELNTEKAIAAGMLPEDFSGRIEAVGNSALSGAVRYIKDPAGTESLKKILSVSKEIGLSMDKDFNELYMKFMMFGRYVMKNVPK